MLVTAFGIRASRLPFSSPLHRRLLCWSGTMPAPHSNRKKLKREKQDQEDEGSDSHTEGEEETVAAVDPNAPPTEDDSIHPDEFEPEAGLTRPVVSAAAAAAAVGSGKPVRNAFDVLMSSKKRPHPPSSPPSTTTASSSPFSTTPPPPTPHAPQTTTHTRPHPPNWRSALLPYILHPETFPPTTVLRSTPTFTTIFDAYPKSTIHLLLIPRDSAVNTLHPLTALSDRPESPALLSQIRQEIGVVSELVNKELHRRYGHLSKSLEPPRTYNLKVGIHLHPSLTHLHIHILTPDMVSPYLKHKKHYNSRKKGGGGVPEGGFLKSEMKCWRCGEVFGSRFVKLKEHLDREKDEWLRE
ncbi:HIT-like domain-containing protein [Kalaharituber pfeilii]|nr:HIT-like domain-containing protein [Kalaharituber pfeilii]